MKLGDVYKSYDLVRERAAQVKKATGLDWEIGGGSQVNLWVTLDGGDTLSEQAQDGICASLVKVFDKAAPNGLTAALAKQGTWDKAKIGASNNQVWCDFPNKVMSQISVEDFVELCDALMQQGSAEIQKAVGKPSESRKPNCSMAKKIESLRKQSEANSGDGVSTNIFVADKVLLTTRKRNADNTAGEFVSEYDTRLIKNTFDSLEELVKYVAHNIIKNNNLTGVDSWDLYDVDYTNYYATLFTYDYCDVTGKSNPDGEYIRYFNVDVGFYVRKSMNKPEMDAALRPFNDNNG